MKLFEYIDRINLLHKLINEQRTGTPEILAKRLGISKIRCYQIIEELRLMEAPIAYSRQTGSYYYTAQFEIIAKLTIVSLSKAELVHTNGGIGENKFDLFCLL
ncbi:hypothetical protein [Chryseobacterium polytrichastri]|uniref:HTH domain-containing protein n=1 Tax=Chryseobacterium polytrichastri TaxID=1302687 RepID=A0A1M7DPN7_9FLAO|nr:hypothetical protein [Chryseobacterium polytrichastri]SHL81474.1 hypothetical protein SAMN05444267_102564 [Chryseobacterium polytrichastri]